jgi:DNA sulfur modification protein DndD
MSVYIKNIQLNNWFNYKGEYLKNSFEFAQGINIIVGDNNAGKTKLYNAIRYILLDNIQIENEKTSKIEETEVNNDSIRKVFNTKTFLEMTNDSSEKLGVKLAFETTGAGGRKTNYILTKEIRIRKDINSIKIIEFIKTVHLIDPATNKGRTISEEFEEIAEKIITKKFIDYLFLEGEQIGLLTPLQGPKLKETINSIAHLSDLDKLVTKVSLFAKNSEEKKTAILGEEEGGKKDNKKNLDLISNLRIENDNLLEQNKNNEQNRDYNKELIDKTKSKAAETKSNKLLVEKLDKLRENVKNSEAKIDSKIKTYISQLMNASVFGISKISDDNDIPLKLDNRAEVIGDYISQRRIELASKLTKKEEKMIQSLEKSQPKPLILEQMIVENTCYVCSQELTKSAISYMQEKLIPFFKNELEEDEELDNLLTINDLFKEFKLSSTKYFSIDDGYFSEIETSIINLTEEKIEEEKLVTEFLDKYGSVEGEDEVDFVTYETAVKEFTKANEQIPKTEAEIASNIIKIEKLLLSITPEKGSESEKYKVIEDLSSFAKLLDESLFNIKNEEYLSFAKNLEEKASNRFQNFMSNNAAARKNKIKVVVTNNSKNDFDFKIEVVDEFGEIVNNPGQADHGLRRLSVIFGLIDISENKRGFPFIVDAPVSKFSPDTKKRFFNGILADLALNQSIVLNMDLWDSESKKINNLGEEILDLVKKKDYSRFITIVNNNTETKITILK